MLHMVWVWMPASVEGLTSSTLEGGGVSVGAANWQVHTVYRTTNRTLLRCLATAIMPQLMVKELCWRAHISLNVDMGKQELEGNFDDHGKVNRKLPCEDEQSGVREM
jgi:hypothetical protein